MPARELPDTTPRTPEGAIDWPAALVAAEARIASDDDRLLCPGLVACLVRPVPCPSCLDGWQHPYVCPDCCGASQLPPVRRNVHAGAYP